MQRGLGVQCGLSLPSWSGPGCVCPCRTTWGLPGAAPVGRGWTEVLEVKSGRGRLGPVQTDAVSLSRAWRMCVNRATPHRRVSPQQRGRRLFRLPFPPPGPGGCGGSARRGAVMQLVTGRAGSRVGSGGEPLEGAERRSASPSTQRLQLSPQLPASYLLAALSVCVELRSLSGKTDVVHQEG